MFLKRTFVVYFKVSRIFSIERTICIFPIKESLALNGIKYINRKGIIYLRKVRYRFYFITYKLYTIH